jgi:TPR repeat protein
MAFSAPAKADYQAGIEAYSKGDFKAALNEWLPLAEGGDATAQNAVGALYDRGLGTDEDDAAAVHWYQLAADQNFPLAMRNLANMYAGGHGVPFDKDQAEYWYQKAAEAGDPVAIKHMAAQSPTGTEFAAAPAAEPTVAPAAPAPEPMTVAGSDQSSDAAPPPPAQTAEAPAPAPAAAPPAPTEAPAQSPVAAPPPTGGTDSSEAPQYGDSGSTSGASNGGAPSGTATVAPTTTQQASLAAPPPMASDPNNWLIGMWQGPSLGCPPDGGLEFAPGETRSYYGGQIAARLPAKYQVSGDQVTVTSTGVDGVGTSYQYERRSPNTFVITAVPADMPQSMVGVEHRRCASAPFAAAAAPATAPAAATPAVAAAKPAAPTPAPAPEPAAKPFVPTAPAAKPAQPAAPQPQAVAAAQPTQPAAAAAPQPASTGSAQDGWDAFGRGDYKGALAVWQPLAEKGDVAMQLLVGSIYDYGQGVPQDDAEAVKWYERAANQGSAKGQYQAGAAYARSPQIKNPVEGYKWLTIAARTLKSGPQGGITADQAITLRTLLEGEMSKDEIARAKQEADAFKATKG